MTSFRVVSLRTALSIIGCASVSVAFADDQSPMGAAADEAGKTRLLDAGPPARRRWRKARRLMS